MLGLGVGVPGLYCDCPNAAPANIPHITPDTTIERLTLCPCEFVMLSPISHCACDSETITVACGFLPHHAMSRLFTIASSCAQLKRCEIDPSALYRSATGRARHNTGHEAHDGVGLRSYFGAAPDLTSRES